MVETYAIQKKYLVAGVDNSGVIPDGTEMLVVNYKLGEPVQAECLKYAGQGGFTVTKEFKDRQELSDLLNIVDPNNN